MVCTDHLLSAGYTHVISQKMSQCVCIVSNVNSKWQSLLDFLVIIIFEISVDVKFVGESLMNRLFM